MKYLVALYNKTHETIRFLNSENLGHNKTLPPQSMFTTKVHFAIPDNSDPAEYFEGHHMELQLENTPIFSFWADDHADHVMYYCKGRKWDQKNAISGYNPGGDKIDVAIVLTGDSHGNYELTACAVQALV